MSTRKSLLIQARGFAAKMIFASDLCQGDILPVLQCASRGYFLSTSPSVSWKRQEVPSETMRLVCVCVYVLKWYFIWVLDYRNLMSIEPSICIHLYWEFWHHERMEHIAIRSDSQNWFRTSTGTSCTWGSNFSYFFIIFKSFGYDLNPINGISNKWSISHVIPGVL